MLWDAASQLQSHESVRHVVFEKFLQSRRISKRHLDVLFEKIKTFPIMKWIKICSSRVAVTDAL